MKGIFALFLFVSSIASADTNAQPAFPADFPKASFDLAKLESNVKDNFSYYCAQQEKLSGMLTRVQDEELKIRIAKETDFLALVCKDGQLIGLTDSAMDSSSKFLVKFEIAIQGLGRMIKYYQMMDENVSSVLYTHYSQLGDYANTGMIGALDKAYNKNGDVNIYSLRDQISAWTMAVTEWLVTNN